MNISNIVKCTNLMYPVMLLIILILEVDIVIAVVMQDIWDPVQLSELSNIMQLENYILGLKFRAKSYVFSFCFVTAA